MNSSQELQKQPKKRKFTKKILGAILFCLLVLPLSGFAKTLAEYRASVQSAEVSTQQLVDYVDGAIETSAKDIEYERGILADIRKYLPVKEKIEWEGTSIEADNQWLEIKLKAFEEAATDWTNRRNILSAVSERLAAIEKKIGQLENSKFSGASKDEVKRKLAEILLRSEYQKPEPQEESWFQKTLKKIRAWFREKFPQPQIPEGASESVETVSYGLQIVLYAVILGFIGFLIYRFAPFLANRFRRRGEKEEKGERVILGEKLSADQDSQTLFDEAEELARSGNLRGAIRKGYIALLCELSDRKIIGLAQHKTNRDYLGDVRKKRELHQNMSGLTVSFERHWYGFASADDADWDEFKQNYQKAVDETH